MSEEIKVGDRFHRLEGCYAGRACVVTAKFGEEYDCLYEHLGAEVRYGEHNLLREGAFERLPPSQPTKVEGPQDYPNSPGIWTNKYGDKFTVESRGGVLWHKREDSSEWGETVLAVFTCPPYTLLTDTPSTGEAEKPVAPVGHPKCEFCGSPGEVRIFGKRQIRTVKCEPCYLADEGEHRQLAEAMKFNNDEFHERHKAAIKEGLASIGAHAHEMTHHRQGSVITMRRWGWK